MKVDRLHFASLLFDTAATKHKSPLMIRTILFSNLLVPAHVHGQQPAEKLNRGIIAVTKNATTAFIPWRLLQEDPAAVGFDVHRSTANGDPQKHNDASTTAVTALADEHA